jgi:AcrR family transcriptional regulator
MFASYDNLTVTVNTALNAKMASAVGERGMLAVMEAGARRRGQIAPIDSNEAPTDSDEAQIDSDEAQIDSDEAQIDSDEAQIDSDEAQIAGAGGRGTTARERRRTRTMRTIQGEALRLFAERGYEQTTIEDIADAADISPRTFFRYFPTKEDVVLWDEYDALMWGLLEQRPADESPGETIRAATRQAIEGLYRRDPERLLARNRLLFTVPAVRGRFLEFTRTGVELVSASFARRRGVPGEDLKLQLTAIAIVDAAGAAFDRWQRTDGKSDLLALLDEAIDALVEGISEMRPPAT